MENTERIAEMKRNLTRFRNWLSVNAVQRAVRAVLPNFFDGDSRKLEVIVDDQLSPRTDGKRVWISLIPSALKDIFSIDTWKTLIFVVLCHETQHNNSSNFEDIVLIQKWFAQYVKDKKLPMAEDVAKGIAHRIHNIVEDGRIEAIAVVRWPGTLAGFRHLNEIIREDTAIESVATTPDGEFADFEGNILSYAKTGLYAPGIKAYAGTELEKNFLKAKPYIDEGVAAKTSQLCREAVEKLLMAVAEYIASLSEQSEELQKQLQQMAQQTPEYTQNNETMYNDGQPGSGGGSPLRSKSPVKKQSSDDDGGEEGEGNSSDDTQGQEDEGKQKKGQGDGQADEQSKKKGKGKGKKGQDSAPHDGASDGDGKKKSKDKKGQGKEGAQDDGSDANSKGASNDGKDGDAAEQQSGDGSEAGASDSQSNSDSNSSDNTQNQESPMGFNNAIEKSKPLDQAQLDELARIAAQAIDNANAAVAEENRATNDGLKDAELNKIKASYGSRAYPINQEAMVIPGTSPIPADLKKESTLLRREIERVTVEKRRSQRGLRQGTLDTNALWKCGVGVDTIFARRRNPQAGSCAFYMLIDNSGSTTQEAYRTSGGLVRKYEAERRAAAVIEDAAVGLIPCKIVLFDQSNGAVNHQIIRTFDERSTKNRSWNSLTAVPTGGCNADSVHISIAAEELRKRSEQKKVLFVLSDGMPSAYGSKQQAESEVNAAVLDARRKGIIVIPIMFGEKSYLQSHYNVYMKMYAKDVIACVPQEITAKLVYLFRQLVAR